MKHNIEMQNKKKRKRQVNIEERKQKNDENDWSNQPQESIIAKAMQLNPRESELTKQVRKTCHTMET